MKILGPVLFVTALLSACVTERQAMKRDTEVFAVAAKALELPNSVQVEVTNVTEAYHPWLEDRAVTGTKPSSIDLTVWKELRRKYAVANRVSVAIPRELLGRARVHSTGAPLVVAFSRPALSANRSFALLTYSTVWQGHGSVGAVVIRRTKAGWQHLETIPLIGA